MAKSDYTWNFNEYFQNDEEFLKTKDQFLKDVDLLNSKLDKLDLSDKLKYYYDFKLISEKLYTYTELKYDSDLNNQTYVKYKDEAYKAKGKRRILRQVDGAVSRQGFCQLQNDFKLRR